MSAKTSGCVEAGIGIEPIFTDLQSVRKSVVKPLHRLANLPSPDFYKHPGQSGNEPKTLQTPLCWWPLPLIAAGLVVWVLIFRAIGVL